jgi:hypothetical protein
MAGTISSGNYNKTLKKSAAANDQASALLTSIRENISASEADHFDNFTKKTFAS